MALGIREALGRGTLLQTTSDMASALYPLSRNSQNLTIRILHILKNRNMHISMMQTAPYQ